MNIAIGIAIGFVAFFGALILLALVIGGSNRRSGGQNANPNTPPPIPRPNWIKQNRLAVAIGVMVILLVVTVPAMIWGFAFHDWWIGKTLVIVVVVIAVLSLCSEWNEVAQKRLVKKLGFLVVIIAISALLYQKTSIEDMKGYLPTEVPSLFSATTTGTTATPTPPVPAPVPKAKNRGKGTLINVPAKVAGDTGWKKAARFQLTSGYLRFSCDIEAIPGNEGVDWELLSESTHKVITREQFKTASLPQNSWVRIRALGGKPIQVMVYTYW